MNILNKLSYIFEFKFDTYNQTVENLLNSIISSGCVVGWNKFYIFVFLQ